MWQNLLCFRGRQSTKVSKVNPTDKAITRAKESVGSETDTPAVSSANKGTATSTGGDGYVLKRSWQGSCRLNLQFFLWKSLLGYNLHPLMPKLLPGQQVADIACGTGVWMMDVYKESHPGVHFYGFDISLSQLPSEAILPSNVHKHQWDMFQEPPAEFIGYFDVIHIRHVTLVIKDNNALNLVKNLRKMLKPGGYLQWEEVDAEGSYIYSPNAIIKTPALEKMFKTYRIPKDVRGSDDWKNTLVSSLGENGFTQAERYDYSPDPAMARYWHDVYMQAWEEFMTIVGEGIAPAAKLIESAEQEVQAGACVMFPMIVWTAKAS